MISTGNPVDALIHQFRSAGVTNPLTIAEQISYLLLLKVLERLETAGPQTRAPWENLFQDSKWQECRWSEVRRSTGAERFPLVRDKVFPFLQRRPETRLMQNAVFLLPTPTLLDQVVERLDVDFTPEHAPEQFRHLLAWLHQEDRVQVYTPEQLVQTMLQLVAPAAGETVLDPSAGEAALLTGAFLTAHQLVAPAPVDQWEHLAGFAGHYVGYDPNLSMLRLGLVNMMVHGISRPALEAADLLTTRLEERFPVIVANIPWRGRVDSSEVIRGPLDLKTERTDLLFVERCCGLLAEGGRCALIVPENLLIHTSEDHQKLRRHLLEDHRIEGIITLPRQLRVNHRWDNYLLFLSKKAPTDQIWFFDGGGAANRQELLDLVPEAWRKLANKDTGSWSSAEAQGRVELASRFVPAAQIAERGYVLSPRMYSSQVAEPAADPLDLIEKLRKNEGEIDRRLTRLARLIRGETQ